MVFKAYLKRLPLLACGVVSMTNFAMLSLVINMHEHSVPGSELDVWASLWLGASTQAGIGYGDLVPKTHIGRACCVLLPLIGLFSMSTMVGNLETLLNANTAEKTVMMKIWDNTVVRKRLEAISVVLIQRRWRLHNNRKKRVYDVHVRLKYIDHLLKFRRYFGVILNEEILLETMIEELGANFSEKYEAVAPMVSLANEYAQMTEDLAHSEMMVCKRASRLYTDITRVMRITKPGGWPTRASLCYFPTISTKEHRRSTRKAKMIITQRFTSWQDTDSIDEPFSGKIFRKRRT